MPTLQFPSRHIPDDVLQSIPQVAIARAIGDDSNAISRIANTHLLAEDILYTICVMCSPTDDEPYVRAREAAITSETLELVSGFEDAGAEVITSGKVARSFAEPKDWKPILSKMLNENRLSHIAAGYICRWVISRWRTPGAQAQASVSRAIGQVEKWCKEKRIPGGGRENLKRHIWPAFRPVAHLWASFYIANDLGIDILTAGGFTTFLSNAQGLLECGAHIIPKGRRAGDAFLSLDEAWCVPDSHVRRIKIGGEAVTLFDWVDDPASHDIRATQNQPVL